MSVFRGNVVDEEGNAIDCNFTLFHYNTGKQSDVRLTELQYWNIDSDDADLNDGASAFASGDIAIIHLWTETAYAVIKVVGDGSDSYLVNAQLLECQAPSVTLYVNDNTIGSEVVASNSSSDEYQWEYEGVTHYHKAEWYGRIFCGIGIEKVEYDFGNEYNNDNSSVYDDVGIYSIKCKATNVCGLETVSEKTITIRKNKPIVDISADINEPKKNEQITLEILNYDFDETIVSQTYFIDDIETADLIFSFEEVKTHIFKVKTIWNDGYDDQNFEVVKTIEMENAPPSVTLAHTNDENNYTFTTDITEGDGSITNINWKIYYLAPISHEWILCYNENEENIKDFSFLNSGKYEVQVEVTDTFNAKADDESVITLSCDLQECEEYAEVIKAPAMYFDKE